MNLVDQDTLILNYNAIVRPYFDYCCEVWDVSKRLQKLQNRAARIVLSVSSDVDHTTALRWEPLQIETKKAKAKTKSLANIFSYKSEKPDYDLWDISSDLCLPKPRTNKTKNSFMYDGAHLWNSISKVI